MNLPSKLKISPHEPGGLYTDNDLAFVKAINGIIDYLAEAKKYNWYGECENPDCSCHKDKKPWNPKQGDLVRGLQFAGLGRVVAFGKTPGTGIPMAAVMCGEEGNNSIIFCEMKYLTSNKEA